MGYLKLTLEPDGEAAGCNPVKVHPTPTGVSATAVFRSAKGEFLSCSRKWSENYCYQKQPKRSWFWDGRILSTFTASH